jgi:hypothetical protein
MLRFLVGIRKLFCKIGWHKPINLKHSERDPFRVLVFAECKWCGFKGQVDSQGNLF